jgi:hypothetical protein
MKLPPILLGVEPQPGRPASCMSTDRVLSWISIKAKLFRSKFCQVIRRKIVSPQNSDRKERERQECPLMPMMFLLNVDRWGKRNNHDLLNIVFLLQISIKRLITK